MALGGVLIATVLVANAAFLALQLAAVGRPDAMRERALEAFTAGDLLEQDYLGFDARRGLHPYGDCVRLQMLSNPGVSRLERALAPTLFAADSSWSNQCAVLRAIASDGRARDTMHVALRYARYWNGTHVPLAFALRWMSLGALRRTLTVIVWGAIALLAVAGIVRGGYARIATIAIATSAALAWGTPYFAPSVRHGVADAVLLILLAGLVWLRPVDDERMLVLYAAMLGAVTVFFESMMGHLPIAAAWLIALTLAVTRDRYTDGESAYRRVAITAAAFGGAALLTIATKVLLATALVDGAAPGDFSGQLSSYMAVPAPMPVPGTRVMLPGLLAPFATVAKHADVLTFGSAAVGVALVLSMLVVWVIALIAGWRARHRQAGVDALVILAATLAPVAWMLLLPTHTVRHGPLAVRMLIVPISLAPLALWWTWRRKSRGHSRGSGTEGA